MKRIVSVIAPTGQSAYAAAFLFSRIMAAGGSAGFAVLSFATAGAAQVGAFAASAAACAFAGGMAGGWLSQAVLRFPQLGDRTLGGTLRSASGRGWLFSGVVIVVGCVVAASAPSASRSGWMISFLLAVLFGVVLALRAVMVASAMTRARGTQVVVLEMGQALSLSAPPALVVALGTPTEFLWDCLAAAAALNLICMAIAGLVNPRGRIQAAATTIPDPYVAFRYGAPLGLWIGLSSIYQNADRVMLTWLVSEKAAGEYSLLYDISSRGMMLPVTAISAAASAAVLGLFGSGQGVAATRANRSLAKLQGLLVLTLLPLVICGSVVANRYVPWFEREHAVAAILCYLAAAVWACGDTLQRERMGTGATLPLLKWLAFFALGGVVLNLVALPMFGIVGAAGVTLLTATGYALVVAWDAGVIGRRDSASLSTGSR